ncbi:hypothetical protein CANINC_004240 [Pichia inconspicua]|uniref:Origin recognition complex subunit 1 n=1 Tax=Pichia inconspicua TaxID=52247 RepID=A0A4V6TTP8_9ASCO|nr:hypothetical protein CANINC_004240 [[Candida] inconspicua]
MAKTQKDAAVWELVFDKKLGATRSKGSSITLQREDGLTLKEGDCISFILDTKAQYKMTGLAFIKDIELAIDAFLKIKALWFVKYNKSLDSVLPPLPNGEAYRTNDLFLTPVMDSILLTQIKGKHRIIGSAELNDLSNNQQEIEEDVFICRRFVNDSTTYFTDLIEWSVIYQSYCDNKSEFYESLKMLTVSPSKSKNNSPIKGTTKRSPTKRKPLEIEVIDISDDETFDSLDEEDNNIYKRRRLRSSPKKEEQYSPTKRSPRKKAVKSLSLPYLTNDMDFLNNEEFDTAKTLIKAKKLLGTGAKLKSLPCREEEFYRLFHELENNIHSQKGCCIYVSGTPGVGKTATIREVIKQLSAKLTIDNNGETAFNFLEINGLKLIKPQQAYEELWRKISGKSASTSNSLNLLQQYFEDDTYVSNDKHKLPLVVLLDELDQIVTKNQAVMYNFFNWPTYQNSKLIVVAVANTMDLPERLLTNKISSRMGLSRIQFTSYSYSQLSEIIKHRLQELSKSDKKLIIAKDAIEFASRKVASVSGDARRSLMICIRAVEIAQNEFFLKSEEERKTLDGNYTVTIMHIMKAVNEASSSPVSGYLNSLSFMSKLVLVSILLRKKRLGIAEIQVGEVYDELSNQIQVLLFSELKKQLKAEDLQLLDIVFGSGKKKRSGSVINTSLFILKDLEENGILIIQPLRIERDRILRLNISDDEILNSLKRDPLIKEIIAFV